MTRGPVPPRRQGFTIIEVLIALAVLMIVTAAAVGVYVTGFRSNSKAALSTQAGQVLAGLGAQITQHQITLADGASKVIVYDQGPSPQPTSLTPSSCSSFLQSDNQHFCATVTNADAFDPTTSAGASLLATPMRHYEVRVCWAIQGGNSCAEANTLY